MIVVAIIGLLASIAVPSYVKARNHAQQVTCSANLHTIFGAKQHWATEGHHGGSAVPADDDLFGRGKFIEVKPACPASGVYTLNAADEKPACSIASHTY